MKAVAFILCYNILATIAIASDTNWPQFRGHDGSGVVESANLPLQLGEVRHVTWKTAIHDEGWSTPVVWGDQIWMTTAAKDGSAFYAVCVSLKTGKIDHDVMVFEASEPQRIHSLNSYATPSPTIEKDRVYVHYGTFGTACLNTGTGEILWSRRDLNCNHLQGPASSVILFEDLLIVHIEGTDVQYVTALDKTSGNTVWRTDRPRDMYEKAIPLYRKAYSTPIVIEQGGEPLLISAGAQACFAYNARTGKEVWRVVYGGDSTVSSPIFGHGLVFFNSGWDKESPTFFAVDAQGSGDITDTNVIWSVSKNVPIESSPVFTNNMIVMVNDRGTASCYEAATGEQLWSERIPGTYGASPIVANGHVYFFSKEGDVSIIKADRTFRLIASATFDDGFMASPAISGDVLILRSKTHVYRIEK